MNDKRLGRCREDGSVEVWPQLDVAGLPTERPATTLGIGNRYFVVLPTTGNHQAAVDELKAMVKPIAPEIQVEQPEAKRKRGDARGSSSEATAGNDGEAPTETVG